MTKRAPPSTAPLHSPTPRPKPPTSACTSTACSATASPAARRRGSNLSVSLSCFPDTGEGKERLLKKITGLLSALALPIRFEIEQHFKRCASNRNPHEYGASHV